MIESLLTFFQYAGPVVATVSSIWAATHKISRQVDGRKTLTRAGRVAIGLAIGGLVITPASSYLKDAVDSQKAADSAEVTRYRLCSFCGGLAEIASEVFCPVSCSRQSRRFSANGDRARSNEPSPSPGTAMTTVCGAVPWVSNVNGSSSS
jgi:hypothetical protein